MRDVLARLSRELAHNAWANREQLKSAQRASHLPEKARSIIAHLVASEWLWLRRLGRPAPEMSVWPELSLSDCELQFRELSRAWQACLTAYSPGSLTDEISYTNSKGEAWTNTVADVLTHVVLHASHHRGQIAVLLRGAGDTPAYVDYIECVRRGKLDGGWPV